MIINYIFSIIIFAFGMTMIIITSNLLYKMIGLNIVQIGVIVFFLSIGKSKIESIPPFYLENQSQEQYTHPLPQTLMLTAIVVGFATTILGFSMLLAIKKRFNTLDLKIIYNLIPNNKIDKKKISD